MFPIMVSPEFSARRRRWISWIAVQPSPDIESVTLFTPDHSCKSLALDQAKILVRHLICHLGVKFICLRTPRVEDLVKIAKAAILRITSEA
jgi:hypothetical protein